MSSALPYFVVSSPDTVLCNQEPQRIVTIRLSPYEFALLLSDLNMLRGVANRDNHNTEHLYRLIAGQGHDLVVRAIDSPPGS